MSDKIVKYCDDCGSRMKIKLRDHETNFYSSSGKLRNESFCYIAECIKDLEKKHRNMLLAFFITFIVAIFLVLPACLGNSCEPWGVSILSLIFGSLFALFAMGIAADTNRVHSNWFESDHEFDLDKLNGVKKEETKTKGGGKMVRIPRFFKFGMFLILLLLLWKIYQNFEVIFSSVTGISLAK